MGIIAAVVLVIRSLFGLFALAVVPWIMVEVIAPLFRGKDLFYTVVVAMAVSLLAVFAYKAYLVYSAYPCPHYSLPDVDVESCGFSAVVSSLSIILPHVLLAWFLTVLFISVGLVVYVYIPEDLNIHLRRYLATFVAVGAAVAWVVVFPWSAPLLLGL